MYLLIVIKCDEISVMSLKFTQVQVFRLMILLQHLYSQYQCSMSVVHLSFSVSVESENNFTSSVAVGLFEGFSVSIFRAISWSLVPYILDIIVVYFSTILAWNIEKLESSKLESLKLETLHFSWWRTFELRGCIRTSNRSFQLLVFSNHTFRVDNFSWWRITLTATPCNEHKSAISGYNSRSKIANNKVWFKNR